MGGGDVVDALDMATQLMMMRDITKRTGALHDAQNFQLRAWGAIAVPKASSFEVKVRMDQKTVTYGFLGKAGMGKTVKTDRLAALRRSVEWLLGPDWTVEVVVNARPLAVPEEAAGDG
jgi:hypothetical protein